MLCAIYYCINDLIIVQHQDGSIVVSLRENSHKRPIIGSLGMDDDSHTSEKKNLLNDHFSAPVFSSITSNKDMKKAFKRMKKSRKRAGTAFVY